MSKEPIITIDWLTEKYVHMEKWFIEKINDMLPDILEAYFWLSKKQHKERVSVNIFFEKEEDMDIFDDGFLCIINEKNRLGIRLEWRFETVGWVKLKHFNNVDSKDWKELGAILDPIVKDRIHELTR